jgi:iron complex transport system ATP-binding protein
MTTPMWSLREVHHRHRGAARCAVGGVTLDVARGRTTALLGPNGAGKSTLLQLLVGTLLPAAGTVHFQGKALGGWPRRELAREIGVVPQAESDPSFSVREIVAMGRYPYLGAWQNEQVADVMAITRAMERCNVAQFADRWLSTLSGGERQRVRLARALAQEPSAFVLDEPTTFLDVRHEMTTFELVHALCREGATIVFATHNLNLAARYADELVLLDRGRVVARGTPSDVLTPERVTTVYEWPVSIVAHESGAPQVVPRATAAR